MYFNTLKILIYCIYLYKFFVFFLFLLRFVFLSFTLTSPLARMIIKYYLFIYLFIKKEIVFVVLVNFLIYFLQNLFYVQMSCSPILFDKVHVSGAPTQPVECTT